MQGKFLPQRFMISAGAYSSIYVTVAEMDTIIHPFIHSFINTALDGLLYARHPARSGDTAENITWLVLALWSSCSTHQMLWLFKFPWWGPGQESSIKHLLFEGGWRKWEQKYFTILFQQFFMTPNNAFSGKFFMEFSGFLERVKNILFWASQGHPPRDALFGCLRLNLTFTAAGEQLPSEQLRSLECWQLKVICFPNWVIIDR